MKKLLLLLSCLILVFSLVACGNNDNGGGNGNNGGNGSSEGGQSNGESGSQEKLDITGITFEGAEFTYDGTEKSIVIAGTLPNGVSVSYSNASATNAGEYNAVATLSGNGYKTLTLNTTLVIKKADITGITAVSEQSIKEDGEIHVPEYIGELPDGVNVKYIFDGAELDGIAEPGKYSVEIVFSGSNYNEFSLNVNYEIKLSLSVMADKLVNAFGAVPDVWSFFPESFSPDGRATKSSISYDSFVNISEIPANGMGKQLNMVYSLLSKTETALSYVNTVYASMNTIKTLYSNYLDGSPENYKEFSAEAGAFAFSISMDDEYYEIFASVGPVAVKLFSNTNNESYGAHIKLNSTTSLKYSVSGKSLTVAMDIMDSVSMLIEFDEAENGNVTGVIYENIVVAGKQLTATSALIEVGEEYTVIIGTKGDFIPTSDSRNCEIYDNETGTLVGTEVREDVDGIIYNTYWFPLISLNGVNTIKKIDEMNGTNADTIYINGSSDTLHTKLVGILGGKKALSRRFDIEFKTMYFFIQNSETGEYESVSMEIPMLFIQVEYFDNFADDFKSANKSALGSNNVSLNVKTTDINAINYGYNVLLPEFDILKSLITHQDIIDFCKQ